MSSSSGGATPAALTVTTSVSNLDLTTSWIRCAISAERLDEELKSKGVEQLFIRLCEQVARPTHPELPEKDLGDIYILKRKAIWLIFRIWSRRRWSFEWLMKTIPLKYQEQFFTQYRKLYEKDQPDLAHITQLTDHHIVAIIFQLRWEIRVGLERHYIRKPPGPVVATGSAVNKAGSLPTWWLQEQEIYNVKTEMLQKNIDALKKIQSEVRCALHFPSDRQLKSDQLTYSEEEQTTGLKVELDELNAQIAYELGSLYFLQLKWTDAQAAFAITRAVIDKMGEESVFLSVDMARFTGQELACHNILAKKSSAPVPSEPLFGKTVDDIPAVLATSPLTHLSPYQRHQLTQQFELETKGKPRVEAKLLKIQAANAVAQILRDNTYDVVFMARAKTSIILINETLRVIESVRDHKWTQFQLGHLVTFVTRVLKGVESPHELSELIQHELVRQMVAQETRDRLQKRLEHQLTPAEPDPDSQQRENSRQFLESQLLSAIEPEKVVSLLRRLDAGKFNLRGAWKVTNKVWLKLINELRLRASPYQFALIQVTLAKVEQLNRLEQYEHSAALLNCLREELPQTHRIAFIEITRLDMLQCCEARQDPSDKLQKAIRQTLTDSGHLSEIPPHWLELAAATLSSAKVNCLPPQSKEPILSFAWSIRELANNSDDYNRMRQVWEQLIYAMVKTGVAAANETNIASQSRSGQLLTGGAIAYFIKKCYNPRIVDLIFTLIVHLRKMVHNQPHFEVTIPCGALSMPREFPRGIGKKEMPHLNLIDDVIDACIACGMRCGQKTDWMLIRGQVYLANTRPHCAIKLLMNDAAAKCASFSGAYPSSTITPAPSAATCLNAQFAAALSPARLQLIARCLLHIECVTQAAICYWYCNDKENAFKLIRQDNRWDSVPAWYECIGSVTLLEFIAASHHRQGHVTKRDMVKRIIAHPDLNANNRHAVKMEIKTIKKIDFFRKIWRLYS